MGPLLIVVPALYALWRERQLQKEWGGNSEKRPPEWPKQLPGGVRS